MPALSFAAVEKHTVMVNKTMLNVKAAQKSEVDGSFFQIQAGGELSLMGKGSHVMVHRGGVLNLEGSENTIYLEPGATAKVAGDQNEIYFTIGSHLEITNGQSNKKKFASGFNVEITHDAEKAATEKPVAEKNQMEPQKTAEDVKSSERPPTPKQEPEMVKPAPKPEVPAPAVIKTPEPPPEPKAEPEMVKPAVKPEVPTPAVVKTPEPPPAPKVESEMVKPAVKPEVPAPVVVKTAEPPPAPKVEPEMVKPAVKPEVPAPVVVKTPEPPPAPKVESEMVKPAVKPEVPSPVVVKTPDPLPPPSTVASVKPEVIARMPVPEQPLPAPAKKIEPDAPPVAPTPKPMVQAASGLEALSGLMSAGTGMVSLLRLFPGEAKSADFVAPKRIEKDDAEMLCGEWRIDAAVTEGVADSAKPVIEGTIWFSKGGSGWIDATISLGGQQLIRKGEFQWGATRKRITITPKRGTESTWERLENAATGQQAKLSVEGGITVRLVLLPATHP